MVFRNLMLGFVIFLMFNSAFASCAVSAEANFAEFAEEETKKSHNFACDTSTLAPNEAQSLLDLLKEGFLAEQESSGTPANQDRDKLENNQLILKDQDSNDASKMEMPNLKIDPREIAHLLNTQVTGSFALGIVLDDSLRAGKCEDYNTNCHLIGKDLSYRNSGAGIVSNVKLVYEDLKSIWDDNADAVGLTKEQNDLFKGMLQQEDKNTMTKTEYTRMQKSILPNSILTNNFDSRLQTNCTQSNCILSSYSLFDKYFNSYFSTEMTVLAFGPTVWGRAKKALGYMGRRHWPWRLTDSKFMSKLRQIRIFQPTHLIQRARVKAMLQRIDQQGLGDLYWPLFGGNTSACPYCLIKTEEFMHYFNQKIAASGGVLDTVTNTFTKRKEALRAAATLRSWTAGSEALRGAAEKRWLDVVKKFGAESYEAQLARIEYGKVMAKMGRDFDGVLGLDWPEMWAHHSSANLAAYGFKDAVTKDVKLLYTDHRSFDRLLKKFEQSDPVTGFRGWHPAQTDGIAMETAIGNPRAVQLYRIKEVGPPAGQMTYDQIQEAVMAGKKWGWHVKLGHGMVVPMKPETLAYITKGKGAPVYDVFRHASWSKDLQMTPEWLAANLTTSRAKTYSSLMAKKNSQRIYDVMVERGFAGRRFTSVLDRAFAEEQHLIKSYFSLKGGAKWTIAPYVHWGIKKGFGFKDLSFYMLPETWKDLHFKLGRGEIYSDAYIDFFANEGSDEGDIFIQVLNYLPWKLILNEVSDKFSPLKDVYNSLTRGTLRDETENLAFYISGPRECTACSVTLNSTDLKNFAPFFVVKDSFYSYILEDTVSEKAREQGQTLITFAHHMDLKGERTDAPGVGEEINLQDAIKDKKTCRDAVKELPINLTHADLGTKMGLILAGMETVSYVAFNWGGIFTSVAVQVLLTPKLQDCVDTEEGYYAHYFIPSREEEKKQEDVVEKSTKKVSELVQGGRDFIMSGLQGIGDNYTKEAVADLGNQIENFARNAEENNIVQATLNLNGQSSGQLEGKKLFYLWLQGDSELTKAGYVTEGKTVMTDPDHNISVSVDNETGTISVNGETIVDNPDHVRLSFDNLKIPAREIPSTITKIAVPDSNKTMFTIDASGRATVEMEDIYLCISEGVEEQTGLPLDSQDLSYVFGKVISVVTDSHPNIAPLEDKIIAEGRPRKIATGGGSTIEVLANKKVLLHEPTDGQPEVGKLRVINFENGQIFYKPQTDELLVWLRHHADGVISQNDVKGLKATIDKVTNPETGCEEPAINFEVKGNPESDLSMRKAKEFNESLKGLGPFQVFETATKRYVLYTGPPPECKEYMRIIDKETGEIEEYGGHVEQTPTGFKFIDDEGKEHTFDFSADDGIPKVSYNGQDPEVLRTAQGRNGSFWYDPRTGLWYAENAQLLPLAEAFKNLGMLTKANPDGTVTSTAAGNIMNLSLGGDGLPSLLNLPSLPEQPLYLLIFLIVMLTTIVAVRRKIEHNHTKNNS